MKHKILVMLILSTMFLSGCSKTKTVSVQDIQNSDKDISRFMVVEKTWSWVIFADRKTKVMYAVSNGVYNGGNFTVLVDADGKPLLWDGED